MAITLSTAARNAMADALVDLVDGGTGAGNLVIMTAADAEVATLVLSNPAFGAAATGAAAANAITDDTSATGGVATLHKFENGNNTEIWRGTTGTSGEDLNLSSTTIGAGDTVSVTAYTVTQPAS